jgi:hypothetical protein
MDARARPLPARARALGYEVERHAQEPAAVDEHEQGEERDRDDADDRSQDAARGGQSRLSETEHAADALLLDRLAYAVDDPILALQEAQRSFSPRQIVDEARDRVGSR